ncbi:nicotinic acid mononucleotide adenyltransferase [uncultured Winogradskyella sp.]|uniref:toxin-antitoxin system YwqK family antitoxin n=1 Tax=uncultured Winogradskyella sp. TaxID=395353 RepID=UPI00262C33E0|nr:nicotinic acid mononucleotide adenyltransferase [uncultured Winogradskyella sp.]
MKKLVTILLVLTVSLTYAQKERELKLNKDKNLIEVTYYYDNGEVSQTGYYTVDGKLHGEWLSFCEEGNKLVSAKYDEGKKVGKWFYWSGNTLKEVDYSNNAITSVNQWTSSDAKVASNK